MIGSFGNSCDVLIYCHCGWMVPLSQKKATSQQKKRKKCPFCSIEEKKILKDRAVPRTGEKQ